jgi:hypothetical protein
LANFSQQALDTQIERGKLKDPMDTSPQDHSGEYRLVEGQHNQAYHRKTDYYDGKEKEDHHFDSRVQPRFLGCLNIIPLRQDILNLCADLHQGMDYKHFPLK